MPSSHRQNGMMRTPAGRLALAIVGALALLMAFQAMPGQGKARAQGADCGPNATASPGQASAREHRAAITCLIAFERKQADRRELKTNRALTKIAKRHTALMLADDCFRHKCPGEPSLEQRLIDSDYLKGGGRFGFGENLGCAETPKAMVMTWMDSPEHKRNILGRKFRHIGVGFGKGAPQGPGSCAGRRHGTYTVIFAWRKR